MPALPGGLHLKADSWFSRSSGRGDSETDRLVVRFADVK